MLEMHIRMKLRLSGTKTRFRCLRVSSLLSLFKHFRRGTATRRIWEAFHLLHANCLNFFLHSLRWGLEECVNTARANCTSINSIVKLAFTFPLAKVVTATSLSKPYMKCPFKACKKRWVPATTKRWIGTSLLIILWIAPFQYLVVLCR